MRFVFSTARATIWLAILVWVISSGAVPAFAAWPLNTPESQTGAMWAGDNLVWNDGRLGSSDVFIRDKVGLISPILTGAGDQAVLVADENSLLISDSASGEQLLYLYALKSHVMTTLGHFFAIVSSSIGEKGVAWSDGSLVWWWDGQKTVNRPFLARQVLMTDLGLMVMEKDQITFWSSGADQIISCPGCVNIALYLDQIATLNSAGTLSLWPSGLVIDEGVKALFSNNASLIYQTGDQNFIYRDSHKIRYDKIIRSNSQIGQSAIATVENMDIVLDLLAPPSVTNPSCNLLPNIGTCTGTGTGYQIISRAVDQNKIEFITNINLVNNSWNGRLLPSNAKDGQYSVSVRAEGAFGELSDWTNLGRVIIDSRPPQITESEVEVKTDRARIHLQTDEKTSAVIILTGEDEPIVRTRSRLTFSHTTTFNDLDAGLTYSVDAVLTDVANNKVNNHQTFSTPPLTDPSYQIISTLDVGQAGVWEGELVLPPGVIDAKQAVLRILTPSGYRLMRLQWTIGLPPPLARHRKVRVKGRVNSAGTAILLHRTRAIAVIDSYADPPNYVPVSDDIGLVADQFVEVQSELTSVTKTGWRVKLDQAIWRVHWEGILPDGLAKGDVIGLKGYTYLSGVNVQIAGIEAVLIKRAVPKAVVIKKTVSKRSTDSAPEIEAPNPEKPIIKLAFAKVTTTHVALQNILSERTITIQTATIYDRNENSWYNLALYVTSAIINFIFFFRRRKITRGS